MKLPTAVILIGLTAFSAASQEPAKPAADISESPDKDKVSYALGMNLGLQLKRSNADVDPDIIAQAIKDVLAGRPTKIQESEIRPLFRQAQAYGMAKLGEKNKASGDAFMAKNAKAEGITVLPSGLQYRVLQAGTGAIPTTNDFVTVNYRGNFVDGTEFDRRDHFLTRVIAQNKGWLEALQLMKVGSKWQIYLPPDIGYGHQGEPMKQIGPDTTLIYELELVAIEPPEKAQILGTGRMGHGAGQGGLPPGAIVSGQTNVSPDGASTIKKQ